VKKNVREKLKKGGEDEVIIKQEKEIKTKQNKKKQIFTSSSRFY